MEKKQFYSAALVLLLGAFSSAEAQKTAKSGPRFLDEIEVGFGQPSDLATVKSIKPQPIDPIYTEPKHSPADNEIEKATAIQLKYALLLDTEVESISNLSLFSDIDDWYGTPYRMGGTTKRGIDCSAFVQTLFATQYGVTLPRTAREQYAASRQISRTELKQGDLLFFNTRGGVSHVGIYLQNNKFVHAASSGGVMVSDLFDNYWVKRFVGVGRVEGTQSPSVFSQP